MKAICQICMHHCSLILSVGSYGCNLRCLFCQNHEISMTDASASEAVYVSPEELLPFIDAMNIDLKGFTEEYYERVGGDLDTVKTFIARAVRECHVELTTLIVPGENDGVKEMEAEAKWIASLGREIPLHVTRFFPRYRMTDREATDVGRVYELAEAAGRYLEHVFAGNC